MKYLKTYEFFFFNSKKKEMDEGDKGLVAGAKLVGGHYDKMFTNLGYDDDNVLVGNCKECGASGVNVVEHEKEHEK